ncbi:MAG: ribonuclease HI family protein [Elusimicrobiaceae bacterium]
MKLRINIDGACRGNPGPGASAVVVKDDTGKIIMEKGVFLGFETTNNKAEFTALKVALECAKELKGTEVEIRSDSQLLVRQYSGQYKVKNQDLAKILAEIFAKAAGFKKVTLTHVPREQNKEADALGNRTLDAVEKKNTASGKESGAGPYQPTLF